MLHHVVCMRFADGVTDAQIQAIHEGLAALPASIPELKSLDLGRDVVKGERSFDFALVAVFEDLDAMKRYQVHPDHQAVLTLIRAATQQVVAVDFEA